MRLLLFLVALLIPSRLFADTPAPVTAPAKKAFRTYVTIEKVSDNTTLELKLPGEKKAVVPQVSQKFEVPFAQVQSDRFPLVIQMGAKSGSVQPCKIEVDMLSQYDRRYVCTAMDTIGTHVQVRVYTDLHGGDKLSSRGMIARK